MAHWHALAKLRQHTDLSLAILESVTIQLGQLLRKFRANTCGAYHTQELHRERAARLRKTANKPTVIQKTSEQASTAIGGPTSQLEAVPSKPTASKTTTSGGRLRKTFNLMTYKDHSLGDYVESIKRYGTVDSYSTESVSSS